jgi:hypothetical protein
MKMDVPKALRAFSSIATCYNARKSDFPLSEGADVASTGHKYRPAHHHSGYDAAPAGAAVNWRRSRRGGFGT